MPDQVYPRGVGPSIGNGQSYDPDGWEDIKGPCPVCEHSGWCRRSADGSVTACRREPKGAFHAKTDKNGSPVYFHRHGPEPDRQGGSPPPPRDPSRPLPSAAPPDTCHAAYSALLDRLTLSPEHRAALKLRGLSDEEIDRRQYRSKGKSVGVKALAGLAERFGVDTLLSVPGFIRNRAGRLDVSSLPGLIIPVRDLGGRITGLMVRPDKRLDGGGKYLWVSSARHGGPSPGAQPHAPLGLAGSEVWRLTEGALKADVAAVLSGVPTVGTPGVTNWRVCLPVLKEAGCKAVRLAFDADAETNPTVAAALRAAHQGLRNEGFEVKAERWAAAKAKGVDDALLAGASIELEEPPLPSEPAGAESRGEAGPAGGNGQVGCIPGSGDNPRRLARLFLDRRGGGDPEGPRLRFWRDEFLAWDGACYRPVPDSEIRAEITNEVGEEFQRLYVAELIQAPPKPPKLRRVTSGLVNDVRLALSGGSLLTVKDYPEQPAWLVSDPPWPAVEVLPARNALVCLPALVAGEESILPPTPQFFCSYALDYDFDPNAPEPVEWLTFLGAKPLRDGGRVKYQLWPDDRQSIGTLQEWFGYLLTPDTTQQKILALIGPKRSGKGTIGRIIKALIGEANLVAPTLSGLGTNFGMSPLIGKPAAIISDARLSGRSDKAVILERLLTISGEDSITIDRKHLPAWTGKLTARITMISNELPHLSDPSGALASRLIILRLMESFFGNEDPTLTAVFRGELPGILNWAVEGWRRLRERGHFLQPESGAELVEQMEDLGSPVGRFLKDRCEVGPGYEVMPSDLYGAWRDWCAAHGREYTGDAQSFGRDLRAVLPHLKTTQHRTGKGAPRFYQGIRLAD